MNPPPLISRSVGRKKLFLVYGESATGKTHMAYEIYNYAASQGLNPVFIATEPGTATFLSAVGGEFIRVLSLDELARQITYHASMKRYIVVDSVNWHYREAPGPSGGRILAYISALLREAGGFATAQVSGGEGGPSGAPYIMPWAGTVGVTRRGDGIFLVELLKPVKRLLGFRIRGTSLEWL
ncbi:MAG: ATP-binding protein [Desulfurococcales archaeon]|nr:ATP-binding protein [Desulfurococcales archaeon]